MLLNKNVSIYNEFLEMALLRLNKSTGADISTNSFNRQMYKSLLMHEEGKITNLDSLLKKFDLLSREGQDLDDFYDEIFSIPRMKGSTFGVMYIKIDAPGLVCYFKNGGIVKMNNSFMEILGETMLKDSATVEVKRLSLIPQHGEFIGLDNNISVDIDSVSFDVEMTYDEKKALISNNFLILEADSYNVESDAEYKARAHGLLQNYGYNNLTKIQKQAMTNPGLSNILFEETKYATKAVIIPTTFDKIDEVYDSVYEIINFFKGGEINLLKPSLTTFAITGLRVQLIDWFLGINVDIVEKYISDIELLIKDYVTSIYLEKQDKTFNMDEVEFIINKYFAGNRIIFSLDENKLSTTYKTYAGGKYDVSVTEGTIKRRGAKVVNTNVCSFEKLI